MSPSPHLGVCPEPRSPSPAGPAFPCASFSATSPLKRCTQEQSGTPCRGIRLSPQCSWSRAPLPAQCTGLQLTGTHTDSSFIDLKVKPATVLHVIVSPYPAVLQPALPPPHWQRRHRLIPDLQPWPAEALEVFFRSHHPWPYSGVLKLTSSTCFWFGFSLSVLAIRRPSWVIW